MNGSKGWIGSGESDVVAGSLRLKVIPRLERGCGAGVKTGNDVSDLIRTNGTPMELWGLFRNLF